MKKSAIKKSSKKPIKKSKKLNSRILVSDIRKLIEETRSAIAVVVNSGLTILYWRIGKKINDEILKNKRAEYGEEIVVTLSRQLVNDYGNGFSEKNIRRMIQFSEVFPKEKIVVTLSRQLTWSHFVTLIPIKDQLKIDFYSEMCRIEMWSVRILRNKLSGMLYERTVLSKKPKKLIRKEIDKLRKKDILTPDLVFKNPYILDFLGLKDTYLEKDLEKAILRELESFILELGIGFSFIARQKRIIIDGDDFYIDLLFYHRKLKRLVAIDLKLGKFKAAYKGQMELYLRWLEKNETGSTEEPPLGLILCTEGSKEQIELLQLSKSGIHVAEYLTELPPKKLLKKKLKAAISYAQKHISSIKKEKENKNG